MSSLVWKLIRINPRIRGSMSSSTGNPWSSPLSEQEVHHNNKTKEFFIDISTDSGREKAVLQYDWHSTDHVDLYHTEVPPVFRGHGIGKVLAKVALDHFAKENIKISPTCTFIQKYVTDNPEYNHMVVTCTE